MNDPSSAGPGWAVESLWPAAQDGMAYTACVFMLAGSSVVMWRGTGEGTIEVATCCGLLFMDLMGTFHEASSRHENRRDRVQRFLGMVSVRSTSGEWCEVPGLDLKPGDVRWGWPRYGSSPLKRKRAREKGTKRRAPSWG